MDSKRGRLPGPTDKQDVLVTKAGGDTTGRLLSEEMTHTVRSDLNAEESDADKPSSSASYTLDDGDGWEYYEMEDHVRNDMPHDQVIVRKIRLRRVTDA